MQYGLRVALITTLIFCLAMGWAWVLGNAIKYQSEHVGNQSFAARPSWN